jgi:hypothetical protein
MDAGVSDGSASLLFPPDEVLKIAILSSAAGRLIPKEEFQTRGGQTPALHTELLNAARTFKENLQPRMNLITMLRRPGYKEAKDKWKRVFQDLQVEEEKLKAVVTAYREKVRLLTEEKEAELRSLDPSRKVSALSKEEQMADLGIPYSAPTPAQSLPQTVGATDPDDPLAGWMQ